jgi:alkylation response protein AidB-like acyl-CoA dehydrogenase
MTTDAMWRRATATAPCQTQRSVGRAERVGCGWHGQAVRSGRGVDVQAGRGETAVGVTEQAIQILGGNGYTREYPVER